MKANRLLLLKATAAALLTSLASHAAETNAAPVVSAPAAAPVVQVLPKSLVQSTKKTRKVRVTGSHIPMSADSVRNGITANHVVIMGSQEIERLGVRTPTQLFSRAPGTK